MTYSSNKIKVVFIGDHSVGKTCVLRCIKGFGFKKTNPTIGVDFMMYKTKDKLERVWNFELWDTAGQERFFSLTNTYLKNADCVVIMFDLTNLESLNNVERWKCMASDSCENLDVKYVLVGNKSDLKKIRVVCVDDIEKCQRDNKIAYCFETSAKNNMNINDLINEMIKCTETRKYKEDIVEEVCKIKEDKKQGCCI